MIKARALALLAIAAAWSCGDQATQPTPPAPPPSTPSGAAVVVVKTPYTDDGAVIVDLQGPGLTRVGAADTTKLFYARMASDSEARVMIVGNLGSGPAFTFTLAAGTKLSAYTATVEQVATRSDSLRTNLSGYTATVAATP
jgi:hypothetical protein